MLLPFHEPVINNKSPSSLTMADVVNIVLSYHMPVIYVDTRQTVPDTHLYEFVFITFTASMSLSL